MACETATGLEPEPALCSAGREARVGRDARPGGVDRNELVLVIAVRNKAGEANRDVDCDRSRTGALAGRPGAVAGAEPVVEVPHRGQTVRVDRAVQGGRAGAEPARGAVGSRWGAERGGENGVGADGHS